MFGQPALAVRTGIRGRYDCHRPNGPARLRIFTEDEELDSAGHRLVGAAAVLPKMLTRG
jgi:hypothetical protein